MLNQICLVLISSCSHKPHFDLHLHLTKTQSISYSFLSKQSNSKQICSLFVFLICTSAPQNFPQLILHLTKTQNQFHIHSKTKVNSHEFVHLDITNTENQLCVQTRQIYTTTPFLPERNWQLQTTGDFPQKSERCHKTSSCFQDFKTLASETLTYSSQKVLSSAF